MSEDELRAIEAHAATHTGEHDETCSCNRYRALVAEVRRLRAEQDALKSLAVAVRVFYELNPGDHVVRGGISKQGLALLERIEAMK